MLAATRAVALRGEGTARRFYRCYGLQPDGHSRYLYPGSYRRASCSSHVSFRENPGSNVATDKLPDGRLAGARTQIRARARVVAFLRARALPRPLP